MVKMIITHPSQRQIRSWSDAGAPLGDRIGRHIDQCDRCASRLDDIAALGASVGDMLRAALAAPAGLAERTERALERRKPDRESVAVAFDFFGAAKDTAKVMMFVPDS